MAAPCSCPLPTRMSFLCPMYSMLHNSSIKSMGHMVECGDAKNWDPFEDDKTPLSCWSVQHGQSVVGYTWQLPWGSGLVGVT